MEDQDILTESSLQTRSTYEIERIRADFPILQRKIHGKPLVYLDNAATTQKPRAVIDATHQYYQLENANIHRGVHYLSELASQKYEDARVTAQRFINAASHREIIFTAGTTDGINLVAACFGQAFVRPGDEIIITAMEHHANIVPWQLLCERSGARLKIAPINERGELETEAYEKLFTAKTRLAALVYISNSLGTINPIKQMIDIAHDREVPVLVDGAQAVQHQAVDVQALDCDFFAFSGHKLYGPTGVGVLYGKESWLEKLPPYRGGGDMILRVSFEKTTYSEPPYKFEAGTPNIAGVIGLASAMDYVQALGIGNIAAHEMSLLDYASDRLATIDGLRVIGTADQKIAVISFVLDGIHPHDIGTWVDREGVAVRTGHHCTQPVMDIFQVPATTRVSMGLYNTRAEIDTLVATLEGMIKVFR